MKDYLKETIDLTGDSYLNPSWAGHNRNLNQIQYIVVHHDASVRPHDYDSAARYRSEAALHYNNLGPGLQYHYKIDNVGQIFKIRPHTLWLHHAGSAEGNVNGLAICLDGYFHPPHNQLPTREQYEALGQLLVKLCEGSPEFPANYSNVAPHSDFSSTACCGDTLRPWVRAVNDKASALNVPANSTYDWPELQPNAQTSPAPQPQPTPPTVKINYRVIKDGKQIGAYTKDENAWNKYKAEGGAVKNQNGEDVTEQLRAKFSPPPPKPAEDHSEIKDLKDRVSKLEAIIQAIKDLFAKIKF